jgi:hypothetical protein
VGRTDGVSAITSLPILDFASSEFGFVAATTEHLFEGAQWPQQIRAYGTVVAGHDVVPGVRLSGVSASH